MDIEPVTEREINDLLPNTSSFLFQYVAFQEGRCDSPLSYHLATGLSLLAAIAPPDLAVHTLPGGTVYANLWCLLAGRPGRDHKTTALKLGRDLLARAATRAVAEDPGTYQGLLDMMQDCGGTALLFHDEFGEFLARLHEDAHGSRLQSGLVKLWDCIPVDYRVGNKRRKVPAPRLSMLAAVNPTMIERHTSTQDWEDGFFSRWLTFYSHSERECYTVTPDPDREAWLIEWLARRPTDACGRCVGLTPEADAFFAGWQARQAILVEHSCRATKIAIHGRTPTMAAKVALLVGYDTSAACRDGRDWLIPVEEMQRACALAELHHRSILGLADMAHPDRDMRDRTSVLRAIGSEYTPYGVVLREAQLLRHRADRIIETLLEEGAIISGSVVRGGKSVTAYRKVLNDDVGLPFDAGANALLAVARRGGDDLDA